jgi:hypothetical protein
MVNKWTKEQTDYLIKNFADNNTQQIADYLGFSYARVSSKAYSLHLKKSPEFLNSERSGIFYKGMDKRRNDLSRFKKGHATWNKGKKMPPEIYEKCKGTMFKPGLKNHNEKFDGALSLRKHHRDGIYIYIRISKAKWRPLHQIVWEKYNGEITPGHKVIFKDKNRTNFNINNLECVSCSELLERNSIHRLPEELKKTIYLTTSLKRQIKKQLNLCNNE